ncbi:MAG: porin [Alphaproteobacteria bacterium]|jgi:phosphate-selective porin OprO/OprP
MRRILVSLLLAGTAAAVPSGPAFAAAAKKPAATTQDPRIGLLEQQLRDVQLQLREIKASQADVDSSAALADLKRSTSAQYVDINHRLDAQTKASISNGRASFVSADGAFTLSLRALMQFDTGYFAQGKNPASVDLNSGTNFRRAQLGFQGTVNNDWAYNFIYDFGGYGVENRGYIYNAYIEYDGLRPFGFRIGAYTPAEGLEDQTSSGELFFPERAASVDVARNLGGAPSREAASIFAQGESYLVSLSYTGKKTGDNTSTGAAVGTFDAQEAVIGRAAWLAVSEPEVKWLVDGHITEVLKLSDAAPSPALNTIRFSNGPEVAVDASKTVDTGNIDAHHVREFGFETAGEYDRFYGQGGWFRYEIERRIAVPNPSFTGWYAFLTYSLTGEQHPYDPATASFRNIRPAKPLGTPGGWGAWEVAVRYSSIDLDFLPFSTAATGGIAGGKQDIWTLGVNWYPNNAIKFQLNYDNIKVNHVNAPANDISADAVVLRSQISL